MESNRVMGSQSASDCNQLDPPCHGHLPPNQVAQGSIQPGLERFQIEDRQAEMSRRNVPQR